MSNNREALLRGLTLCVAVVFVGLGIWLMLQPQAVEDLYPIKLTAPMAFSEVRAIFGGLMMGVGVSVLLLDLAYERRQEAAMVLATVTSGLVLSRTVRFSGEGFPSGPVLTESIFEIVLFILLMALGADRRTSSENH